MLKLGETTLFLDLNTLEHNFKHLKSKLKPGTKFLAVVKAFAYGSDANIIAQKLQYLDADYFAVAYTKEGVALRDNGITKPIVVLHPQPNHSKTIIDRCLEPSLYSFKSLNEFLAEAKAQNQSRYPVHIKFNTGLNRLGFTGENVAEIAKVLSKTEAVKVTSAFSHLAVSEDLNEKEFTLNQIDSYKTIAVEFERALGHDFIKHICNTSGILNYPEAHFDMVRSGIGLYGFGNSKEENQYLRPIASLKSVISQIHHLNAGESVGYNRGFTATSKIKSATIPIGHADGLGRQYGKGKGYVIINGKPAHILGNVCMDMIMVNVTDIECREGDEVLIFGSGHTAETLAKTAGTISYEIITAISQRVKREVVD